MTFDNWMNAVDRTFVRVTGLGRDDWPDQNYWDMWNSGLDPIDAVLTCVEDEYGEEGLEAFGLES